LRGHIRKRSKGSWTVVIDAGRDLNGKRRQVWRSVRGTKRDAEALLSQLIHERNIGAEVVHPERMTVADFLRRWLNTYAKPNTAPRTYRRYEQLVRVNLTPHIGTIPLTKLRPLHIQDTYTRLLSEGLSAQTVVHCHRVLKGALGRGCRWQLLSRNPADSVDPPTPQRYQIPTLSLEDANRLLAIADETRYGTLVFVAALTGMRVGELCGLRWVDVDFDNGALAVRQTLQWMSGEGFTTRQPKTYRSTRPVSLGPDTIERLKDHRLKQLKERLNVGAIYNDNDLVFATTEGKPIHPSTLRAAWLKIAAESGLKMRLHDLRHLHASLLLRQGTHPKIVSERLGHSTVGITLDLYSHTGPTLQVQAATDLESLLANG